MVFCACDEQFQNGVDQGSDGVLSLQEFSNQVCQVWIYDIFVFFKIGFCAYKAMKHFIALCV